MAVAMTMTQPAQSSTRFVEKETSYHSDSAGPDPELKKVLPLLFASLGTEPLPTQDGADGVPPFFVDNYTGTVIGSQNEQKRLPIIGDDLVGISTYFSKFHPGIDYRAKIGTAIHAVLPGVVNEVGFEAGGYGRFIILVHHVDGQTMFSLYAHMRVADVMVGQQVDVGTKIGEVGLTGHTTGPHLHFELHDSTHAIDPMKFFGGSTIALAMK